MANNALSKYKCITSASNRLGPQEPSRFKRMVYPPTPQEEDLGLREEKSRTAEIGGRKISNYRGTKRKYSRRRFREKSVAARRREFHAAPGWTIG